MGFRVLLRHFHSFEISSLCARNQQFQCAIRRIACFHRSCVCKYAETRFNSSKCRFLCVFLNERHMAISYAKRNLCVCVCVGFFSLLLLDLLGSSFSFNFRCTIAHVINIIIEYMRKPMPRASSIYSWCAAFTPFNSGRRSHLCTPCSHTYQTSDTYQTK